MTKLFWNITTHEPIVVDDAASVTDFEGYTDVEPQPVLDREKAEQDFRALRSKVLAATDSLVLPDRNPPAELLEFRQFLRDVPNTQPDFSERLEGVSDYGNALFLDLAKKGLL